MVLKLPLSLTILDCGLVTIGSRVMIGPAVSILAATHEVEVQSRRDNIEYAQGITIGNDCWIGGNVVILVGVKIGDGCTVGAGSVVTKDIPPFSVAVGSPARVIKNVTPVPEISD
jgi:acetyltransferase-like isoleucine patch superfamily enzyme